MPQISPSELDRRLAASDPAQAEPPAPGLDGALDGLMVAIMSLPRPSSGSRSVFRARRPRRLVLSLAALLLVGGTATAATSLLTARTGQYARGWQVKAGGPGEYLREAAPNFCRAALQVSSSIPYPPGDQAWRRWVLIAEDGVRHVNPSGSCASFTQGGGAQVSTGAQRGYFAMSAFCAWTYDWRNAIRVGDQAAAARASREIAAAPRWAAVTAEDPHPSAGPLHETRSGLTGSHSIFGWFLPFRRAVSQGDRRTVNRLIASNYGTAGCSYFDPPAASHGGTVNPVTAKS